MSDFTDIGLANSNDVLNKLKRDKDALESAILKQEELFLKDAVVNFFNYGYHIKDWLKKEGRKGVESYINNNFELRICADICNGAKHKILTRPLRTSDDPVKSVKQSEITWDSTAYTFDSTLTFDSKTYSIELESGNGIEIKHFANTVVKLWEEFMVK